MEQTRHRLRGKLEVDTDLGSFLGDTRIRLLEAIAEHGSISRAAKAVPLSYKAAWDAVDTMNNLADEALVTRATGGKRGGGTTLTDYGRKMIALYRALEAEYQAALERLAASMQDAGATDIRDFQRLLRRISMKTSARNQFAGTVVALRDGGVDFEVHLRIDADHELVAIVTRDSATNLGLAIGTEVHALVKSSAVLLLTDPGLRVSAGNQLWGEITRIHDGPVNCEVTLAIPGGKSICAVITQHSAERLGLAVGGRAGAVFKASDVILCLYT
ncbi:TOBE domain-containing protein [Zoogloea sp.]|uniref:TOBE domain-containing protein n=1 Tax=Zoogloea sp. TaxID=49181 RepID=UPI00261960A8|nr:TOBE domain-containing protein [uncultured Zoogloea sp.]